MGGWIEVSRTPLPSAGAGHAPHIIIACGCCFCRSDQPTLPPIEVENVWTFVCGETIVMTRLTTHDDKVYSEGGSGSG